MATKRRQYTLEDKLMVVNRLIKGEPLKALARSTGIDYHQIRSWAARYEKFGIDGLQKRQFRVYSNEIKLLAVHDLETNGLTLLDAELKYGADRSTLKSWRRASRAGRAFIDEEAQDNKPYPMIKKKYCKEEPKTELERLQLENKYLKAELALIKKLRALVQEEERRKQCARKPSKN